MDFDFKSLTEADNVFMTYNNIIQCVDMFILDFMKSHSVSERFDLSVFQNSNDNNLLRMLNRKDVNIFNLLSLTENVDDKLYYQYLSVYPMTYNELYITDFIKGFNVYMHTKSSVNKLTIATGNSDIKKQIIKNILGLNNIEFVNDDDSTIEKYIQDSDYNLIFTDRSDLVNNNISYIKGKVICFPYVSYLFDIDNISDEKVLMSKDKWEIKSFNKEFTIGYFQPFKITESMFVVG